MDKRINKVISKVINKVPFQILQNWLGGKAVPLNSGFIFGTLLNYKTLAEFVF